MDNNYSIPNIILEETKHLPEDLLKEVLDFILFLKDKNSLLATETGSHSLSIMQENELTHLEDEFKDYKILFPNE